MSANHFLTSLVQCLTIPRPGSANWSTWSATWSTWSVNLFGQGERSDWKKECSKKTRDLNKGFLAEAERGGKRRRRRKGKRQKSGKMPDTAMHEGEIEMTEHLLLEDGKPVEEAQHAKTGDATIAIIFAANSFDSADKALLSPAFRALEMDFSLDPKSLGGLVFWENVIQSLRFAFTPIVSAFIGGACLPAWPVYRLRPDADEAWLLSIKYLCVATLVAPCLLAPTPAPPYIIILDSLPLFLFSARPCGVTIQTAFRGRSCSWLAVSRGDCLHCSWPRRPISFRYRSSQLGDDGMGD